MRAWRRHGGLCRSQQRVPLTLHGLDLLEKQFEPIELTVADMEETKCLKPSDSGYDIR